MKQQRTILRAVEQKTITPVGSTKAIKVDTRLFCATNDNLAEKVADGTFREDLFYRLSEFVITIPALRERMEDIPVIINSFIDQFGEELNPKVKSISDDALKFLMKYNWPGNVRQLRNIIRRAMVLAEEEIKIEHLNFSQPAKKDCSNQDLIAEILNSEPPIKHKIKEIIDGFEKKVIQDLMIKNKNNISKVSKIIGYDRKTIYSKLDQFGLNDKLN